MILDGKMLSEKILAELKSKINQTNFKKKLAVFADKNNFSSAVYADLKKKKSDEIGLVCDIFYCDETTDQKSLENKIKEVSSSPDYAGVIIQHPLPKTLNETACFNLVPLKKDVDGLSAESFGKMAQGEPLFIPATVLAIIKLLSYYNIEVSGENILVIGKSQIIGLPLSIMLMKMGATVTTANSKTKNLPELVKNNKIIISATGVPFLVKSKWLTCDQIVIDAGYSKNQTGDVEKDAKDIVKFLSPVPGGVGPMTIAMLLNQTYEAGNMNN